MKKIQVISQREAEKWTYDIPYVHISIRSPGAKKPKLSEDPNRLDTLFLIFHDVDSDDGRDSLARAMGVEIVSMTKRQADLVARFVKKWQDKVEGFVINCEAGISRSAGIAAAIAVYRGEDDDYIYKGRYPNVWCKTQVLRAFQGKTE